VLDKVSLGYTDEEEETASPADRNYWETIKGTPETCAMADEIEKFAKEFAPNSELSYNKHYIGFWVDRRPCNFAICRPQRNSMRLEISLPKTDETDLLIEEADIDFLEYDSRWTNYRLRISRDDLANKAEVLTKLLNEAYQLRV